MKKILLALILCLFTTVIFSQRLRVGIDPGLAISRGSYTPEAGLDRRVYAGFDGGILVEIRVVPKIFIQPEINYSMIGVELNNGTAEFTKKLRYVTLPLLIKVKPVKRFAFMAGPQLGILTAAGDYPAGISEHTDTKEKFKPTDFVMVVGTEYKLIHNLFISARYNLGLTQIAEEGTEFEMKNRWGSLRLGFIF